MTEVLYGAYLKRKVFGAALNQGLRLFKNHFFYKTLMFGYGMFDNSLSADETITLKCSW